MSDPKTLEKIDQTKYKSPHDVLRKVRGIARQLRRQAVEKQAIQMFLDKLESSELLEVLAAIEHERWSGWERHRESVVCEEREEHWRKIREVPYADLPEYSKESDRTEARKTLAVIREFLTPTRKCNYCGGSGKDREVDMTGAAVLGKNPCPKCKPNPGEGE